MIASKIVMLFSFTINDESAFLNCKFPFIALSKLASVFKPFAVRLVILLEDSILLAMSDCNALNSGTDNKLSVLCTDSISAIPSWVLASSFKISIKTFIFRASSIKAEPYKVSGSVVSLTPL